MQDRYAGDAGKRRLLAEIEGQRVVQGDSEIASALVEGGEPMFPEKGDAVIDQGATTNDVYFIVAGAVDYAVNGCPLGSRLAGRTVGEISAINPRLPRTATVTVQENTVLLRVPEAVLAEIGARKPVIWRRFAADLAERLADRNIGIRPCNDRPRLFIICSVEGLRIAEAIQFKLDHSEVACEIWSDGVFKASTYPTEALDKALDEADFTVAIASPDDIISVRGVDTTKPRDNVMVELGMSIRSLGRRRSMILVPRNADVHLPSDFKGLTPITFNDTDDVNNTDELVRRLGPACHTIKQTIRELGVRR